MPWFPGTGAMAETGVGNIWNAPFAAGDASELFRTAWTGRTIGMHSDRSEAGTIKPAFVLIFLFPPIESAKLCPPLGMIFANKFSNSIPA